MGGLSSLATPAGPKMKALPFRSGGVFGFAVHQCGSSAVEAALKKGIFPLDYLVEIYLDKDSYSPAYVIGYDGKIVQVTDEGQLAQHIGFAPKERSAFLDGTWEKMCPPGLVGLWKSAWPGVKSPAHLFPGPSPNHAYVGAELLPLVKGVSATPMFSGSKYTTEQHQAVVDLGRDIATRHAFPSGWHRTGRLVGHEDVNPLTRSAKGSGWDPGYLRGDKWFDFTWVRARLDEEST